MRCGHFRAADWVSAAAAAAHSWTAPPLWALRHSISISSSIVTILTTSVVSYACTWTQLHFIYCFMYFYFRFYRWLLCCWIMYCFGWYGSVLTVYYVVFLWFRYFWTNMLVLSFLWLIGEDFIFLMMKGENNIICVIKICMFAGGIF